MEKSHYFGNLKQHLKISAFIRNLGLHEENTETIGKIYFLVRQNLEAENKHKILLVFFFTYRYCYKITFP